MAERRYALDALIAATGLTEGALARKVRLSGSTLKLARERGFTEEAAERYAARAGFVVWQVWPEWIEDVIADESIECAERSCTTRFVPTRRSHKFCSPKCNHRHNKRELYRRRYAEDPEFRAQEIAKSRRYRETNKRAAKLKKAAYYRRNAERIKARKVERYRTDPEYRERVLAAERERNRAKRERAA